MARQELEQRATALTFINNSDHLAVFMGPIAGLSPNSKELSKVKIFNLPDLKLNWESGEIAEPGRAPTLRSNHDGSLLGLETRQSLYVWETRTWKLKHNRAYQGSYSLTVFDFHPTEDKIALIDQGNLIEISSQTFKTLRNLGSIDGIPQGFCYSPNGKRIVVGNKRGFTLINSFTGAPLVKVETEYSIFSTSFTPDGKFLLTSSNENQLFQAWKR